MEPKNPQCSECGKRMERFDVKRELAYPPVDLDSDMEAYICPRCFMYIYPRSCLYPMKVDEFVRVQLNHYPNT